MPESRTRERTAKKLTLPSYYCDHVWTMTKELRTQSLLLI